MIKELRKHLQVYEMFRKSQNEGYEKKKAQYFNTYGQGAKLDEVMQRTTEAHNKALNDAMASLSDKVEKAFTEANEKLAAYVTEPLPEGFAETLESIKAMGNDFTPEEAELFYNKFADNYTARKALSKVFQGVGLDKSYENITRSYEMAKKALEESKELVYAALNNPEGYSFFLLQEEENNILDKYDRDLDIFLGGGNLQEDEE